MEHITQIYVISYILMLHYGLDVRYGSMKRGVVITSLFITEIKPVLAMR